MAENNALSLNRVNQLYFDKLFVAKNNTSLSGPAKAKVLLVDEHTLPIAAVSYSQSQLLQQDVILVEMLGKFSKLSEMKRLNCILYIKPCRESIAFVCDELRNPHYCNYQLFFSNTVSKNDLERIAAADEFEVINQVVEIFQEYTVVNDNLFCVSTSSNPSVVPMRKSAVEESSHLMSLLLSLRKCPVIKYDSSSLELKRLASEVLYGINSNSNNNLFEDLGAKGPAPVLLIIDRNYDPLTPLITPWTYQSMIHELIGITQNIVRLSDNDEKLTLSETQDDFFHESMYLNYGDLTDKFQKYVDDYKRQTKQLSIQNLKTQDLLELKRILTRFPEFKKLSNNILKHLNIISELDKQISLQNLWAVGELQQTIVCNLENHQTVRNKVMEFVSDPNLSLECKIKLILLYASKHPQNTTDYNAFVNKLKDPIVNMVPPNEMQWNLLKQYPRIFRASFDLEPTSLNSNIGHLFSQNRIKIQQLFNSNANSVTALNHDNIYMQYVPKLEGILQKLIFKLEEIGTTTTPSSSSTLASMTPDIIETTVKGPLQDIIVYFKGGVTYEEARLAHEMAKANGVNIVVGSEYILNSSQWLLKMTEHASGCNESPAPQPDRRVQLRDNL